MVRISASKLERAEGLVTLGENPNWEVLRQMTEERMNKRFAAMARLLMMGRPHEELNVEYWRGYFAGQKFLLDQPDLHKKILAKADQDDER